MPQILIILILAIISLVTPETIFTQISDAAQKTQNLVAALSKTKYKKKEKKNFVVEIYIDIKNESVIKNNIRDYAGIYESESAGHRIELRVPDNGKIEGNGHDTKFFVGKRQNFTLTDAKIEGALLTATKVYENGKTENFEAVFVNRTIVQGKNPNQIENRETKFGLGFVELEVDSDGKINELSTSRVFCEFKP